VIGSARAVPLTFEWDDTVTGGHYQVHGVTDGRMTRAHRADVPEGAYRITGPGFDTRFRVEGGKVRFQPGAALGVVFDSKAGKFRFVTASIEVDASNLDLDVGLPGIVPRLPRTPGKPQTVKLVAGKHRLTYPGGEMTVVVDARGKVSLPNPIGGVSAAGSRLTLAGGEIVFDPGAFAGRWQVVGARGAAQAGRGSRRLLPTTRGYALRLTGKGAPRQVRFLVNDDFLVRPGRDGTYQELMEVDTGDKAAPPFTVGIPDGRARYEARRKKEAAEKKLYEAALAASAAAPWKKDFALADWMRLYDFPEELLHYAVEFPAGTVRRSSLKLLALHDDKARPVPFQLSDAVEKDGFLTRATLSFRSDLPKGGSRLFRSAPTRAAAPGGRRSSAGTSGPSCSSWLTAARTTRTCLTGACSAATPTSSPT
jgi:hypothetical protein